MERLGSGPVVSPEMSLLPRAVGGLLCPGLHQVSACAALAGGDAGRAQGGFYRRVSLAPGLPGQGGGFHPPLQIFRPASYARAYGILVAQCVRDHWDKPLDGVTWTPLSRQRRRERGYDQAQLLAKWTARELELPVLGMLDKVRDIPPQSGIQDDARRRANVLGAYRLRRDARPEGMNLLLVDDVVTSGSTLSECARLLSGAGAETVVCATLAQARKN